MITLQKPGDCSCLKLLFHPFQLVFMKWNIWRTDSNDMQLLNRTSLIQSIFYYTCFSVCWNFIQCSFQKFSHFCTYSDFRHEGKSLLLIIQTIVLLEELSLSLLHFIILDFQFYVVWTTSNRSVFQCSSQIQ